MAADLTYQSGFGNEFASEALPGALPRTQIAPQKAPLGLYVEELNGTAFTAPRGVSRSTWNYRIRPSTMHKPFKQIDSRLIRGGPFNEVPPTPNQLRWRPLPVPAAATDFIDGLVTLGGNGDPALQTGAAIHVFAANAPMRDRFFYNADGEMLVVLQMGRMRVHTELGILEAEPGEILVLPRGIKFRVELPDGSARGYICENYGQQFRLPELGPIGTFGLANARDFMAPNAAFEDREGDFRVVAKYGGLMWEAEIGHSPLDVVAWRGNYVPYKYDLHKFQCINTVTFDHPDPSSVFLRGGASRSTRSDRRRFIAMSPASSWASYRGSTSARRKGSTPAAPACTIACRGTGPMPARSSAAAAWSSSLHTWRTR